MTVMVSIGIGHTHGMVAQHSCKAMPLQSGVGYPFLIDGGEGNDPLDIPEDRP